MSSGAQQDPLAHRSAGDVRRLREMWVEAFNRREVERVVSFYAEDAVELPLNGEPATKGLSAMRELLKAMFAAGFGELRVRQTQVGYTEPLAVEAAMYTIRAANGSSENGRLVATWRRDENGKFKITINVWSKELE